MYKGLIFALVMVTPASAQSLSPNAALNEMAGQWKGKLEYKDYQSDNWFAIPQNKTVEVLADGVTRFETSVYDDGPTGQVYIYGLNALEKDGLTLKSSGYRKGRDAYMMSETVTFIGQAKPGQWIMRFEATATDDERPARLRTTLTYSGNSYTTLKEIDFTDDAAEVWVTRNKSALSRVK
jgi:hypothetical protein